MSEFAITELVRDLAGFGVTIVVLDLCLERAQDVEAATGEVRIDQDVLQRNDQAVPAERGDKPRQAGGWQKNLVIGADDRQPERRHVLERLAIKTVELLIAGADLQHGPQPVRQRFGVVRLLVLVDAFVGGVGKAARRLPASRAGSNARLHRDRGRFRS